MTGRSLNGKIPKSKERGRISEHHQEDMCVAALVVVVSMGAQMGDQRRERK